MTHQERDRLSIAVGFSVVVHLIIAVLSGVFGTSPDLPDYLPPLRVELNAPEPVEPVPVPLSEAEPEPPAPTEPPEPTPETAPAPATPAPQSQAPAGADPMAERPGREFSLDEIMGVQGAGAPRDRRQSREDVLQADPDSLAPDVALPDWAGTVLSQAGVSTEQMSVSEATDVADRIRRNPEFRRLLSEAIEGVNRSAADGRRSPEAGGQEPSPGPGSEPGTADGTATDGAQGDPRLSWQGGDRGAAGPLPELTAADFGNQVPAEVRFVVIFEVNDRGGVVPGSIIFQQRSLYTAANQKLRSAVASWRFDPKPGAPTESAVFTLVVRREDVR